MKHWNLGNTTVRNPYRIRGALRVLKNHFEGKQFTEKEHLQFFEKLQQEKVLEPSRKISKSTKERILRKWGECLTHT